MSRSDLKEGAGGGQSQTEPREAGNGAQSRTDTSDAGGGDRTRSGSSEGLGDGNDLGSYRPTDGEEALNAWSSAGKPGEPTSGSGECLSNEPGSDARGSREGGDLGAESGASSTDEPASDARGSRRPSDGTPGRTPIGGYVAGPTSGGAETKAPLPTAQTPTAQTPTALTPTGDPLIDAGLEELHASAGGPVDGVLESARKLHEVLQRRLADDQTS